MVTVWESPKGVQKDVKIDSKDSLSKRRYKTDEDTVSGLQGAHHLLGKADK